MFRNVAHALLFTVISLSAFAQKTAAVQEGSVWAPVNTKIDAKLNEWGDNFQAFNKTTNIYYTMANDGNNLYLAIKSANQANNNKIIGGGITFTVNTDGKKKDNEKDAFVMEFPVINYENLRTQMMSFRGTVGNNGPPDSAAIQSMRKKAVSAFKEVKLFGFKDISDSVISVYNEYGIKAFVDFDDKGSLAIEMALPLKYLQITSGTSFAYNIKLNGINLNKIMPGIMIAGGPGGAGFGGGNFGGGGGLGSAGGGSSAGVVAGPRGGGAAGMPRSMDDMMSMLSPTDFWGKYTLAKKQ